MSEVAARLRSQKRGWAHPGSGHDRVVRLSLLFLPVGIGVLSAFLVLAPLLTKGEVSFVLDKNKVELSPERLRLEAAVYRGEDEKGQPFRLNAGSAIQKSSSEPIVKLNQLAAEIKLPEGPATLKADKGHYDMDKQQVTSDGPINFQTTDGYTLDTTNATVDLKTRKLESGGAVTGKTPTGVFSANKLTADLENRTISLDGNARLRITPKRANRR
ncbi:LPS export ABC transporter periplasmic protein LptC [Sphingomonas kyeonggiensis]|uniref:Lipopolysaccharide export system protein LptC n=1 Tax=Sphingomonas kyeonggiensis TaxID=1268553 RepID=A0A7W6NY87_9SPHN|nr:LPS export ABC transporter periplasmic protein LptC [Sphingomonas kyeonggiensis]MBB4100939.1 lipopolysaccharide export system protein LptC [Sphingomonas kyeonggiensis]